ncbi:hypothetical protein VTN00DRAFT_3572 [Thermoascus crustaceus]|uniref:uncharacterized protein n=1 Tax=Thermoascus crustaceus TaxID=5088 RepID=UPI00374256E3
MCLLFSHTQFSQKDLNLNNDGRSRNAKFKPVFAETAEQVGSREALRSTSPISSPFPPAIDGRLIHLSSRDPEKNITLFEPFPLQ